MARLAKEGDIVDGGSMTRLATEPYVDAHASSAPGKHPDALASVTGLGWYKPNDLGLADNDPITTLTNKLAPGTRDLTAAGGARPTFRTNKRNGKGTAVFAGAQVLSHTTMPFGDYAAVWIVAVIKTRSANDIVYETATSNNKYLGMQSDTGGKVLGYAESGGYAGVAQVTLQASPSGSIDFYNLVQHKVKPGDGAIRNQIALGRQALGANTGTTGLTTGFQNKAFYVGARNGGSVFWTGELAEMFIAGGDPSAQDEADLLDYLAYEWRI